MARVQVISLAERLEANPKYAGKGVVMGFVDSGFFPHADLMKPERRIKAYADVTREQPRAEDFFEPHVRSWHGMMTACSAAGNGYRSQGLYRGLAHRAEVVLIKAAGDQSRILGKHVASAVRFPLRYPEFGIRILNVSLGVDAKDPDAADVLHAVREVTEAGITVFAAAGNRPDGAPEPPASSAHAITVGGSTNDNLGAGEVRRWPSSFGEGEGGVRKPDLLAPAIWVPAPMLPGTPTAREGQALFHLLGIMEEHSAEHGFSDRHRAAPPDEVESVARVIQVLAERIKRQKFLSPDYQHVDGTSFAAPITASVAAQMLEVDPTLTPPLIRQALLETALPFDGVPAEQQGAGLLQPRAAVEWVLRRRGTRRKLTIAPPAGHKGRRRTDASPAALSLIAAGTGPSDGEGH
ncbi:MAG: S8 family serine peptidase [Polyangiaceae bacterium]|nr:S8 family serine peptidase [Polyangiaceae bacterium]